MERVDQENKLACMVCSGRKLPVLCVNDHIVCINGATDVDVMTDRFHTAIVICMTVQRLASSTTGTDYANAALAMWKPEQMGSGQIAQENDLSYAIVPMKSRSCVGRVFKAVHPYDGQEHEDGYLPLLAGDWIIVQSFPTEGNDENQYEWYVYGCRHGSPWQGGWLPYDCLHWDQHQ